DPMVDCTESKKRYRADQLTCVPVKVDSSEFGDTNQIGFVAIVGGRSELVELLEAGRKRLFARIEEAFKKRKLTVTMGEERPYLGLEAYERATVLGPDATQPGTLTEPRQFNLMFESHAGPIQTEENKVYLRPETAQGIFVNYRNVLD